MINKERNDTMNFWGTKFAPSFLRPSSAVMQISVLLASKDGEVCVSENDVVFGITSNFILFAGQVGQTYRPAGLQAKLNGAEQVAISAVSLRLLRVDIKSNIYAGGEKLEDYLHAQLAADLKRVTPPRIGLKRVGWQLSDRETCHAILDGFFSLTPRHNEIPVF